jgi:hypothetical protein
MTILALEHTGGARSPGHDSALARSEPAPTTTAGSIPLLQRNTAEVPDPRYWTPYDYWMIEREARAMRAARVNALVGKGWRACSNLIFG